MLSHHTRHDASRDASDRVASRDEYAPARWSKRTKRGRRAVVFVAAGSIAAAWVMRLELKTVERYAQWLPIVGLVKAADPSIKSGNWPVGLQLGLTALQST